MSPQAVEAAGQVGRTSGREAGSGRRAVLAAALAYFGVTALLGQHVLANLGSAIASDPGDPLLNAAILAWNASHPPGAAAWWQFPSFHPLAGTVTFTEHLLGLSVLATPIHWVTGDALVTYNLTLLLTYPLCALGMYALALRLTGSHAAAFLGGLAFALAPYRIAHLSQIQVVALFWAPLALLGLHAWLETRRRRWLALFGTGWALQGLANSYMLVFFSLLVAAWVLWFVVLRRRWRDLGAVALATALAIVPLAPILYGYLTVHAAHGFSRTSGEIAHYGADIGGLLCASPRLALWGWLDVACRAEGELYAGFGLALLIVGAVAGRRLTRRRGPADAVAVAAPAAVGHIRRVVLALAALYVGVVTSVLVFGPWQIELGPLRASASSPVKPLVTLFTLLLIAGALSPRVRDAVRHSSVTGFYAGAALCAWMLAWGPSPRLLGEGVPHLTPYGWLMWLPGLDGLRVPARFWMIAVLCLSVLVALVVAEWLKGRSRRLAAATVVAGSLLLLGDGWGTIPVAPAPAALADPAPLRGEVVLELPLGNLFDDVAAQYRAVTGGWRSVNGYSGYEPRSYHALRVAQQAGHPALFDPFRRDHDLQVLVAADAAGLRELVERQPGAQPVSQDRAFAHYRLPRTGAPASRAAPLGERIAIGALDVSCNPDQAGGALDDDPHTRWTCGPQDADRSLTIDIGRAATAGIVVPATGTFGSDFPRMLIVETSLDGQTWEPAREGPVITEVLEAYLEDPRGGRIVLPFEPRQARWIRLRQVGRDDTHFWSVASLEVWSGA